MSGNSRQPAGALLQERRKEAKTPKLYSVVLLNDDYTTMEFVVSVLENVFQKSVAEAFRLMMHVHTRGRVICGTYSYEVAETKANTIRDLAAREGFPLQASVEEE